MPLDRVLEPEVMDTQEEAVDYDAMDHRAVNRLFVDHLLQAAHLVGLAFSARDLPSKAAAPPSVLDVGTGTAQIPIELGQRGVACRILAIDLARHMLDLANRNIQAAGLEALITTERVDAKGLPYSAGRFDLVMSNSIVHHIPRPIESLREMVRVLRPEGLLFVRDLMRPETETSLRELVDRYAGGANAHQRRMFAESLHAALTLEEVRGLLAELKLAEAAAVASSDRHWTIAVRLG